MPIRPDFPIHDMLDGRDVVIVVRQARAASLLEELQQRARELAPFAVSTSRTGGRTQLQLIGEPGRIRIIAGVDADAGRGTVTDTLIIDAALAQDMRVREAVDPMLVTAREPVHAVLDV